MQPQDYVTREKLLRHRALAVLGLDTPRSGGGSLPDRRELHYSYHCRMLKHHPDRTPDEPRSHEIAALINEAYALLTGRRVQATLLLDEALVRQLVEDPVTPLDKVPSYEQWLKERFLNVEHTSIWAY